MNSFQYKISYSQENLEGEDLGHLSPNKLTQDLLTQTTLLIEYPQEERCHLVGLD